MTDEILLVDDDAALRTLLSAVLTDLGCAVIQAGGLAEARAVMTGRRVRVAIVDGVLPDGDGVTLLGELRAADPDVSLIYISAYLPEGDELGGIAARVRLSSVLGKPFSPEQLLMEVEPLLEPHDGSPDVDVLTALRAEYAETLDAQVGELEAALADGDLGSVRRVAHRLHGTAGTYGFDEVSAAAGAIESTLPQGATLAPSPARLSVLARALRDATPPRGPS